MILNQSDIKRYEALEAEKEQATSAYLALGIWALIFVGMASAPLAMAIINSIIGVG